MEDRLGKILLSMRINAVLPYIKGYLLDIGCGTNELVKAYPDKGIGVDVYPWGGVDLVVENTAVMPFENNTFDTVTIVAALNHIPNRHEVLMEAHRVMRYKGRIIITMISPMISRVWHFLRSPWDVDQSERGMRQGEVFGISNRELKKILKYTGFIITKQQRFMLGFNCLTIAQKLNK